MRLGAATLYDPKPRGNYPRRGSLSDAVVVKMRLEYARGYRSAYQLSAEHGISQANVTAIVQGSTYKAAGGLITWPNGKYARPLPAGKVRGHCWDVACFKPIASSGWAQRMHMCESCFRINGGKRGRKKSGKERSKRCPVCRQMFTFYATRSGYIPKTCSIECGQKQMADAGRKRPDDLTDDRLYELYWGQNLTAPEIAARYDGAFSKDSVIAWLIAANIPRRAKQWRRHVVCMIDGCEAEIYRLFNGNVWYGRLCKEHLRERDTRRRHYYEQQSQQESGAALMREIATLTAGLPEAVKMDAEQEIMVAALSGDIPLPLSRESVKPLIARVFRENADAWKFVSIQAPTRAGEDAQTWGERLGI